ncbi:ankyrin repeat domain-containing protein [Nitrosospira lacus]|nr:ankyrin repeat domain-containing protein [Nitrosospira lacus]
MNILKVRNTKIPVYSWLAALLLPLQSHALDCPGIPEQAHQNLQIEVRAAVGRIGSAKGAELETLTRDTTRDLLGKLPQADKVYLEQMMYATYCSTLRDDPALNESQKSARIKAYNLELKKTLQAVQGKDGSGQRGTSSKDAARAALARIPLPYTPDAFIKSAGDGNLSAVRLFLAAGMNPNAKDEDYDTALMYASGGGHIEIVKALLKAKANVNERNYQPDGSTALSWAASAGRKDILSILLDHGSDNAAINDAFLSAAESGQAAVLRMLLKQGADKGLFNKALIRTAESQIVVSEADLNDVVQFLLEQGANVDARDDDGKTALMKAVTHGRILIMQTLLDAGADINAQEKGGSTALRMAAWDDTKAPIVKILLARGADPNLADNVGQTPLILASASRNIDIVRALLDKGADANARDAKGSTALMGASRAETDAVELLRALLEKHADVNAKDNNGLTALMLAAANGPVQNVGTLLDAGADLHAKDAEGSTALMLAVSYGRVEIVQTLLRRGAKVKDEDANGKTVLNYAEEDLKGQEKMDMMRILKKAGAQ